MCIPMKFTMVRLPQLKNWSISAWLKKLLAVHVHDNDGSGDSHQPVGLGTIEWEPYFASIRDYAPNALQILEYAYIEPGVLTEHLHKLESRYGALRF